MTHFDQKEISRPSFLLFLFVKGYIFLRKIGLTKIPKVKGLFFHIFYRLKNKKGVMKIPVGNRYMNVDLADTIITTKLIQYGVWEESLTNVITKIVKPEMITLDIGAHVGYYSLLFASCLKGKGRVYSFEPDVYNFTLLQKNISENGFGEVITIEQKAVSDTVGVATLHTDKENYGAHSIVNADATSGDSIETITIDSYLKNKNTKIDFVKIDVEGAEYLVLQGMTETIRQNPNIYLVMEFFPPFFDRTSFTSKNFFDLLASFGLTLYVIPHDRNPLQKITGGLEELLSLCKDGLVNILCTKQDVSHLL